jgi:hypothetical protein
MTNFNNDLHKDLFDLFIMAFAVTRDGDEPLNRSRSEFELNKKAWIHDVLKDLFPQENHPESYVRYMSDGGLSHLRNGGDFAEAYTQTDYFKNKIIITIGDEG